MRLMALSIVPFSLLNLLAEALRGLQRIGAFTLVQGVLVPLTSVLLLAALHYTAGAELTGAAQVYVASCLLAVAGSFCLWRFYLGRESTEPQVNAINSRTLLNTANPMAWVALISVAMSFTETLWLGVFRTAGEVGLYAAALRLALLLNFVIIAFNSILAPKFACFYHAGDLESVRFIARRSIKLMLMATSPVFALYILAPGKIMQLFGAEFADASLVLTILTLGQLVNIATGPVGIMLMMTGNERVMRKNLVLTSAFTIFIGAFMVWRFGIIGAASSATTGMLLLNVLSVWAVWRRLGVPATITWVDEK
jgi:O-antigen/teichoic acid export membrane protein